MYIIIAGAGEVGLHIASLLIEAKHEVAIIEQSSETVDNVRHHIEVNIIIGNAATPKVLREWFCCEMGRLGIPDRYVDAFCGRVPRSVLARHYTDFSPERLKEIYDKAQLTVIS